MRYHLWHLCAVELAAALTTHPLRTPSPRASIRMGDEPESTVQAETTDDEAWAAIDAWLEKRHDAPPKAESRPQRTRHRWTCTSKGHVHDTFLATGTKSWEALGASPRLTANLEQRRSWAHGTQI